MGVNLAVVLASTEFSPHNWPIVYQQMVLVPETRILGLWDNLFCEIKCMFMIYNGISMYADESHVHNSCFQLPHQYSGGTTRRYRWSHALTHLLLTILVPFKVLYKHPMYGDLVYWTKILHLIVLCVCIYFHSI